MFNFLKRSKQSKTSHENEEFFKELRNDPHAASKRKLRCLKIYEIEEINSYKELLQEWKEGIELIKSINKEYTVNEFISELNLKDQFYDVIALCNIEFEIYHLGLSDSELIKRGLDQERLSVLKELTILAKELNLYKLSLNPTINFFEKKGISKDDDVMYEIMNKTLTTVALGKIYRKQIDQINSVAIDKYKLQLAGISLNRMSLQQFIPPKNELKENLETITAILQHTEIDPLLDFFKSSNVEIEETGICPERLKFLLAINRGGVELEQRIKKLLSLK